MNKFEILQIEVENYLKLNNHKNPDGWIWKKENNQIFFIEKNTNKKRKGILKNCKYCDRVFAVSISKEKTAKTCSRYCHDLNIKKESEVKKISLLCSLCGNNFFRKKSSLKKSKSGLYFCSRKCKDEAQKIGGIDEIQPEHYKNGIMAYSQRALKHYGYKCFDCNIRMKSFLKVHHIDGNIENGAVENLEVLCMNHHMLRHMKYKEKTNEWIVNFKYLTPRNKLNEIRKLMEKNIINNIRG